LLKIYFSSHNFSLWSTTDSFGVGESIADQVTYSNFRLKVASDTIVVVDVYDWLNRKKNAKLILHSLSWQGSVLSGY